MMTAARPGVARRPCRIHDQPNVRAGRVRHDGFIGGHARAVGVNVERPSTAAIVTPAAVACVVRPSWDDLRRRAEENRSVIRGPYRLSSSWLSWSRSAA